MATDDLTRDELRAVEAWFLHRGIPLFIADYDAETRVWTRALPFLVVAYMLLTAPLSAEGLRDAAVEWVFALALLPMAWVIGNRIDGRPTWSRPKQVGVIELVTFVTGPALPHLIERDWVLAAVAAGAGIGVLGLTFVVVAYGVVPLLKWMAKRLMGSLGDLRVAAARALPFLLLFVTFFFFTAETWQTFARLEGLPYGLTLLLFLGVGTVFVNARLRPDVEGLEHFDTWEEACVEAASTPAARLVRPPADIAVLVPLSKRERRNVQLVAVASQVILAALVAAVIGCFFLVLGVLTADHELISSWVQHPPQVYLTFRLSGRALILAEEHIRVAGFLAVFSGFYFGVYSVTDPAFRQGLTDDAATQLRPAFAARALYRGTLTGLDARRPTGEPS